MIGLYNEQYQKKLSAINEKQEADEAGVKTDII